jgi:hypothetical protein
MGKCGCLELSISEYSAYDFFSLIFPSSRAKNKKIEGTNFYGGKICKEKILKA